mgnify:CR=1 FL=1
MAYKMSTGLNDTTVVNSNVLRNTDDRLYVSTASGLNAYNTDGTYTTMANMANFHPIFIPTPIVINPGLLLARVTINQQYSGKKVYELKDLPIPIGMGNVRATITDRKFLTLTGTDPKYQAEPVTATDYYAFGSPLYGRNYTAQASGYRFGFNTQKKVDEVSGDGNHNTAEFWEYDTRLGRRWNTDPVEKEWESPYVCFAGNPVLLNDPNGDVVGIPDHYVDENGEYLGEDNAKTKEIRITSRQVWSQSKKIANADSRTKYLQSAKNSIKVRDIIYRGQEKTTIQTNCL